MRIVVGAPVRDRAWILPVWLESLLEAAQEAKRDGIAVSFVFCENDSEDQTYEILDQFKLDAPDYLGGSCAVSLVKHDIGYKHYRVSFRERENTPARGDKRELAVLRNLVLDEALDMGFDYFVSWDSDVLMPRRALTRDLRSLISVMERLPEVRVLAADVQHPHCKGRYHNYMVQNARGVYLHPGRAERIDPKRVLLQFAVKDRVRIAIAPQVSQSWSGGDPITGTAPIHFFKPFAMVAPFFVAAVESTGGGGAVIMRRDLFVASVEYGAHEQGEDIPLCEQVREAGARVAMYSGIRGLHVPRDCEEELPLDLLRDLAIYEEPYGIWWEDLLSTYRQRVLNYELAAEKEG